MERDTNYTVVKYLILSGDTGSIGHQNHYPLLRKWLIETCKQYKKVFYINGNNDCKGTSLKQGHDVLRQWEKQPEFGGRLIFLEKGRYDLNEDGHDITILGCTLWTKLEVHGDGEVIVGHWCDWKITDNSARKHHERFLDSYEWLEEEEIQKVREERGDKQRIVVATHHSPAAEFTTAPSGGHHRQGITYTNDILFKERIKGFGESENDFWVFGHTHFSIRRKMDKVNVYFNQRGGMAQEKREEREKREEALLIIGTNKDVLRCRFELA